MRLLLDAYGGIRIDDVVVHAAILCGLWWTYGLWKIPSVVPQSLRAYVLGIYLEACILN